MPIFRVMTFNVLYGATNRERLVREVVQEIRPDVAVFTEARGTKEFESVAKDVGNHLVRGGGPMDRDFVVVASRWPIDESQRFRPGWGWSKWIRARIRPFGGPPLTVVGVQLPAHLLWPFEVLRVLEVGDLMGRVRDGTHIIAGDFNAVSPGDTHRLADAAWWVRAQWLLQSGFVPRWSLRRMKAGGFEDCYRACHPTADGFTVPAWNPQVRMDYVFASSDLAPALRSSGRQEPRTSANGRSVRRSAAELLGRSPVGSLAGEASDHLAVWADFEWPDADMPANIQTEPTRAGSGARAAHLAR